MIATEYKILSVEIGQSGLANALDELSAEVTLLIDEDWGPLGAPIIDPDQTLVFQAIIKS